MHSTSFATHKFKESHWWTVINLFKDNFSLAKSKPTNLLRMLANARKLQCGTCSRIVMRVVLAWNEDFEPKGHEDCALRLFFDDTTAMLDFMESCLAT
jgi:hypothetical protein